MKIIFQKIGGLIHFISIIVFQIVLITSIIYIFFCYSPNFKNTLEISNPNIGDYFEWYKNWLLDFVVGDFGKEKATGIPVGEKLAVALQVTFTLTFVSIIITYTLSVFLYWIKRKFVAGNSLRAIFLLVKVLSSVHYIVLAFLVRDFFNIFHFHWNLYPFIILAIGNSTLYEMMNHVDEEYNQILNSQFIKAAKARGGNVLRNSIVPLTISTVRTFNALLPLFISNAFIVEYILGLPGIRK